MFLHYGNSFSPSVFDWRFSLFSWLKIDSAAKLPLFIAVWVPLILGTFMKPGLQPISKPPGKVSFGIDWKDPEHIRQFKRGKTNTHPKPKAAGKRTVSKAWKRMYKDGDSQGSVGLGLWPFFYFFFSYLIFISMGQNYQNIFEMTCFYLCVSVSQLKDILNLADKL